MLVWPEGSVGSGDDAHAVERAGFDAVDFDAHVQRVDAARVKTRAETKRALERVRDDLERAQSLYLEQDYVAMDRVLADAEGRVLTALALPQTCDTLWELEFRRGLAARGSADVEGTRARFRLAAALRPDRRPDPGYYGPDVAQAFAEAAEAERSSVEIPIDIEATPADATRVVDCVAAAGTGVELSDGLHVVWAVAPGFRPAARVIDVSDDASVQFELAAETRTGAEAIAALPDVVRLDVGAPSSRAVLWQVLEQHDADALVWLTGGGATWEAQLHADGGRGKVHLADTRSGAIEAALAELGPDGRLRMVAPAVAAPAPTEPSPARKPLARRWWFWVATGSVVLTAVAVGLVVGLRRGGGTGSGRQTITVE